MRTLIENYRGFEIYFDSETEDFYTISEMYDNDKTKKSFSLTKKYIDDYIKENNKFNPFFIEKYPSIYSTYELLQVVGIRKDGDFIVLKKGVKHRFSRYDEKTYCIYNKLNEPILKEIELLDTELEKIRLKKKEIEEKLIKYSLGDYRKDNKL